MAFKWSMENCINLINNYKQYPCLWKCTDTTYRCREAKNDAWIAISLSIGCKNKEDVKRKMKNLVAQFYRERRKYQHMKRNGVGANFIPKWYAYNYLLFLLNKNMVRLCKEEIITEDLNDLPSGNNIDSTFSKNLLHESNEEGEHFLLENSRQNSEDYEKEVELIIENESQKPLNSAEQVAETANEKTFQSPKSTYIKKILKRKSDSGDSSVGKTHNVVKKMHNNNRERDSYAIFGEHVACKIRKLRTECARNTVEHLISNILFEAAMGKFDNPSIQL